MKGVKQVGHNLKKMITETKQSINSILYERISSPLFGTFILTWVIWNWKILFTLFFVSEEILKINKVDYIVSNFKNSNNLIWGPIVSTIIILTIIPFISNGAYWLSLKFKKWRIEQKNIVEKKQLLSIEQSIQLREQIMNMDKKFESILSGKNNEISQLNLLIENYRNNKEPIENSSNPNSMEIQDLAYRIISNQELSNSLETISSYIQGGYSGLVSGGKVTSKNLSFFESNKMIVNNGKGMYSWTEKGLKVNKLISDEKFN